MFRAVKKCAECWHWVVTSVYLIPILLVFEVVLVGVAAYLKLSLYMQAVVAIGTLGMASASFAQLNREDQRWMERNTPFVVLDLSDADPPVSMVGVPGVRVVTRSAGVERVLRVHDTITNISNVAAADCVIGVFPLRRNARGLLVGWRRGSVANGLGPNTSRAVDLELDNQRPDSETLVSLPPYGHKSWETADVEHLFGWGMDDGKAEYDFHIVLSYVGPDGRPCHTAYAVSKPSPGSNDVAKLVLKAHGRGAYDEAKWGHD